jgi:hypothetical protein
MLDALFNILHLRLEIKVGLRTRSSLALARLGLLVALLDSIRSTEPILGFSSVL